MRCLIVDDDITCRTLIQSFLADVATCSVALDGYEAIEAVQTALETGRGYHLICLDLMMPNMDGLDTVKVIRQLEKENGQQAGHSRILITTALNIPSELQQVIEHGADACLVKPLNRRKFLHTLVHLGLLDVEEQKHYQDEKL